ncbi:MAG: insulinase family protein [Clostridiales bacterium]|nr:insulinase family protein [Clostridiales bacterium]
MEFSKIQISDGVELISVPADRFKTNEISFNLALELNEDTAAANALAIFMLSRKGREYPDMQSLNRRLAGLYGAALSAAVTKVGENQVLHLDLTALDDRFSFDGESIAYDCVRLLSSLLFDPKLDENGYFYEADVEAEKRLLIEKIASEENEKRTYVLRKTEELMFTNEPYGINRYSTPERVKALTPDDVLSAWKNMLSSAKVCVTVVGNTDSERIATLLTDCFAKIKREYKEPVDAVFVPESKKVNKAVERIDIKQGKLVLGFRVNMKPDNDMAPAMHSFCDIFGGGPYSKLFANVREKLSLCYYCSARYTRLKSCIMIQCGCNEENMDTAVNEILNQLEEIKKGNFDEEFNSSKLALRDTILSVNDSPFLLEAWYSNQIADPVIKSPKDSMAENAAVTKEQVQKCASLLTLDTAYRLVCTKEGE